MKRRLDPELIVDDGFYRLYSIPVTLRKLREKGILLYPVGAAGSRRPPLDEGGNFRIVFGSVHDDSTVEGYWGVETRINRKEGESWTACEVNDDSNYDRIYDLLGKQVSRVAEHIPSVAGGGE